MSNSHGYFNSVALNHLHDKLIFFGKVFWDSLDNILALSVETPDQQIYYTLSQKILKSSGNAIIVVLFLPLMILIVLPTWCILHLLKDRHYRMTVSKNNVKFTSERTIVVAEANLGLVSEWASKDLLNLSDTVGRARKIGDTIFAGQS